MTTYEDKKKFGLDKPFMDISVKASDDTSVRLFVSKAEKDGISVELVDPLTIKPFDLETVAASVRKTGRLIIIHESPVFGGTGAEHGSQIYEACFEDLKKLAPNVLAYDTDSIKQKFIAEEAWIGTMWSGDAYFTHKDNPDVAFVIPKEGTTVWADTLAIPKGAKHKELAEKFIDYLYDPQVSAKNYEYIGYNDPNTKAAEFHTKEYLDDPMLRTAVDEVSKGEWLTDIGDAITIYDKDWTELKTIK